MNLINHNTRAWKAMETNIPFDRVYSFKFLGLILSCNLSWSSHINSVVKRAKRIIGLLYRQFYPLSSSKTLLSLALHHHSPPYPRVRVCHLGPSFSLSLILHWICSVLRPQKDSEILVYFVCWSPLFPQATYPAASLSPVKTSHFLQV